MVVQPHQVDELGLAGEIDVVGARRGARGDQGLAVLDVRPDGRDHHLGRLGELTKRAGIAHVGFDQGKLRCSLAQPAAHVLELLPAAPRQRPAGPVVRMLREVLRGQRAGETGRSEQDERERFRRFHS